LPRSRCIRQDSNPWFGSEVPKLGDDAVFAAQFGIFRKLLI